ncbi:MAG TPA: SDR family oxidoreductase [Candidatus Polarisedimenticolia bacterium]|nr:SDR family oxidoreductase [Candidatus Polarisedimenticolia bacterium]
MRLRDRVALVIGGASGIGLATAERFLEEGARVVIADIAREGGDAAVAALRAKGHEKVAAVACDVSRGDQVARLVEGVVAAHGRIDVLFNNAGLFIPNEVHQVPEEEWARLLAVNLTSVYLVSKQVVPHMLARGRGAIVNNSSVAGLVGDPRSAAYCATKGGVALLTRAMALDYARRGIRVNAICCGEIDTPLFVREAGQLGMTIEEFRAKLDEAHPIGRIGRPREAADAVVFLASGEASFITGVLLPVDGGYSAV